MNDCGKSLHITNVLFSISGREGMMCVLDIETKYWLAVVGEQQPAR